MTAETNTTSDTKWYALRVVSGKERKLRDYIEQEVKRSNWDTTISQILVPTEKVFKIVNGKKTIKEKNFFPGYILIESSGERLSGEMVQTIRSINGVIHFLGKESPTPLRKSEVNRILGKVDAMQEGTETTVEPFLLGEKVRITDGPFNDFKGTIEEINDEKKKLKVIVMIFGRRTPVEVNFIQVEKA